MSFNPRMSFMPPTMMPGLPNSLPSMSVPPPRPFLRPGVPTINSLPQMYNTSVPPPMKVHEGPIITVFVGNISDKAPDPMVKKFLQCCGSVVSWKRVATFGFCEYDGPVAGLRAVRLLHEMEVDGKKLVAKVDAKNKVLLDQYEEDEKTKGNDDADGENDKDTTVMEQINSILAEYKDEMTNHDANQENKEMLNSKHSRTFKEANIEEGKRDLIHREIGKFRKFAEEEEQKKEKEKDRKKRDENRTSEKQRRTPSPSNNTSSSNKERKEKDKDKDKDKEKKSSRRNRSKSREREREAREIRERERERERDRERERERERDREREREREREEVVVKPSGGGGGGSGARNIRDMQRDKEMEDENRERKKIEKKAREKEDAYQERLKIWETRERRKAKDYEKEKEKERCKEEDREKEAKRLKEFLEDYDDERDDSKYYKGREMQRRLADRVREADMDAKDRNKEQEELDDLKSKIFGGEFDNPNMEYERLKKEREDLYRPKILIDVNLEQSQQREREQEREREREVERQRAKDREKDRKERYVKAQASRELASINAEPIDSDSSDDGHHFSSPQNNDVHQDSDDSNNMMAQHDDDTRLSFQSGNPSSPVNNQDRLSNNPPLVSGPLISLNLGGANSKKKKLEMRDVFNMEEENEDTSGLPKKRKLVPLDYEDKLNSEKNSSTSSNSKNKSDKSSSRSVKDTTTTNNISSNNNSSNAEDSQNSAKKTNDELLKTQEEKRKHIKSIIDKIPTEKIDLFNYNLDWSEIDAALMDKKIRPWINKKIIEYIGEPEPTLVDFICSKVMAGSSPQGILDDVQMVLDEEAEVFVVKMWRLLIYEVEAKKSGLVKA